MNGTLAVQRVLDDEVNREVHGILKLHQRPGALMVVGWARCFDKHIEIATACVVVETGAKNVARCIITKVMMKSPRERLALLLAKAHVAMVALR